MTRSHFKLHASTYGGIEAVEADTTRAFKRHIHLQYGLGVIDRGAQKSASGRGVVEAGPGNVITVNPGEVHDGLPLGDKGRAWRMLYLEPSVWAPMAQEVAGDGAAQFEFHRPVVADAALAAEVLELFAVVTGINAVTATDIRAEECLLRVLSAMLRPSQAAAVTASKASIATARSMIDDDPTAPWSLTQLASQQGLSRFQLVRHFQRVTGLTPHAYLVQQRVHHARKLIHRGKALAEAAFTSGFADQSHLTRAFVATFGYTPGTYSRAMA